MNSKKIFLVTVFEGNNYGSSLQAYALKNSLEETYGCECQIISRKEKGFNELFFVFRKRIIVFFKTLLYPGCFKKTWSSFLNKNKNISIYDEKTLTKFQSFQKNELKVSYKTFKEASKLSKDKCCLFCLCGSDQIWSPIPLYLSPFNFLRFAPKNKRFSYACSFGVSKIPNYNRKKITKFINDFNAISLREESSLSMIEHVSTLEKYICLDPTLLVGKQWWEKRVVSKKSDYIFVYFLNVPKIETIKLLDDYFLSLKKRVIVVAKHKKIFNYGFADNIEDCGPFDFLSLLKGASLVITDSYHGTILSTLFCVPFFVFEREYGVNPKQNSRLVDFLSNCNLSSRFICSKEDFSKAKNEPIIFDVSETYLKKSRIESKKYLESICDYAK